MSSANASTKPAHGHRLQKTLDKLMDFAKDVEKSVNTILPTGAASYGTVAVLGYTWSNDDLNCKQAEKELFEVLRKHYNFVTESFVIDAKSVNPYRDLQRAFAKFTDTHDSEDALLIFVYSGHSHRTPHNELQLFGDSTPNAPWVNWSDVRGEPSNVAGRALLIFDSCYAATAATDPYHGNGPELLAASGISNTASGHAVYNFTATLKNALEKLKGKPRTVGQIYSEMCRDTVRSGLRVTPAHILQNDMDSVVLERTPAASSAFGTGPEDQRKRSLRELGDSRFRVLIQVHLRGDVPDTDLDQWKKWLRTNLPMMVDKITLEARYCASSTVVQVLMPIEVWDGLPAQQSAYSFVSWVKGGNTLQSSGRSSGKDLPIRERKENVPFAGSSRQGAK